MSWDFNENVQVPVPRVELNDRHGTRCAGLIAGEANNGICGVGVAYDAQVSAIRILSKNLSTQSEAAAVVHKYDENHIFSCSWGPADDGKALDGPPKPVLEAFVDGLVNGRSRKGSIYVFAAGNGKSFDNCNYDGYANGVFSATIGAIDSNNAMPVYMEPCAAQLAVTYSSGQDRKIATTDLGGDSCTMRHGGTSAAAPLAAGVFALVLQARPELTWRDLQHLVVQAAQPVATLDTSWRVNGAGRAYSQKFGFGKIDAEKLVTMAETWKLVRPPAVAALPFRSLDLKLPVGSKMGLIDTVLINDHVKSQSNAKCINQIEHVTVTVDLEHPCRGEIQLFLRSPSGMVAQLATRRPLDKNDAGLRGWTFMTVAFWGEQVDGPWTLNLVDKRKSGKPGRLVRWRIGFWGESRCIYDSHEYRQAFVSAYYPPSPDYFEDGMGLWKNESFACGIGSRHSVSAYVAPMVLLVLAITFIRYMYKSLMRRRYRPVSTNTIQTM